MRINNISVNIPNRQPVNIKKAEKQSANNDISFQGKGKERAKRAAVAGTAVLMTVPMLSNCNVPQTNIIDESQVQTPEDIAAQADALRESGILDKIILADISLAPMPVTEFYFTNDGEEVVLYPNEDLPRNDEGTIIVTISEYTSDSETSGNTLNEIISKVYSEALEQYDEDEREAIKNKIIDEIIQSNPSLAEYVAKEMGDKARSYKKIAGLDLYKGVSSSDQLLDTRLLTMPTSIVYQVQGKENPKVNYFSSSEVHVPASSTGSVIKDEEEELLDGEYTSFSDLIYGMYGEDISDEAYRDIVYAVVNAPQNAADFEYIIDKMDFNDIIETANINDLNRTLDENTDKELLGIFLPTVTTLRTVAGNADVESADKDGIIYQISPVAYVNGQNDRVISILSNEREDGLMEEGQVFKALDVLQFYNSPDGNGRFANVEDGKLELNTSVNYVDEFALQILQQVAYANLNIFAAEYEDENGIYNYGVFDVRDGYDTEGKSLEEIIQNSTINIDRLMSYSFVNENGESKFEDGVKLTKECLDRLDEYKGKFEVIKNKIGE